MGEVQRRLGRDVHGSKGLGTSPLLPAPRILAGPHVLRQAAMSKSKKTENQNYSVDTQTRNWMQAVQNAATNAGMEGPSPLLSGAAQYGTGLQNAGATGAAALGGDQAAINHLMNPYQQN